MPLLQTINKNFIASVDFKAATEFRMDSNGKPGRVLRVQGLVIDQLAREDTLSPASASDPETTRENWVSLLHGEVGSLEEYIVPMAVVLWRGYSSELESEEAEANDKSGQTKTRNEEVKNNRKALMDESAGGKWSFFISPKGFFGLASLRARYTDKIVVLLGASVPFVLRQEGGGQYELVGEAYVNGLMNGEAITMMQAGKVSVRSIDIL